MHHTPTIRPVLACLVGIALSSPSLHAEGGNKFADVKGKVKVEVPVGEKGKVGAGIDSNDKKEASIGYGPLAGKVTSEGAELEVSAGPKFGSTQLKAKATLQGGVEYSDDKTFYKNGVPTLKVDGTVGVEASAGAGPVKGSVTASKKVFSKDVNIVNYEAENARLTKTLQAANGEEYLPEKPKPPESKPSAPTDTSIAKTNAMIAEYNKNELAEAKRLGKTPKLMEPLPVDSNAPAAAPAAPAERMVSGYMILPRPADFTDEDWQFFAKTMGDQLAQFNLGGMVQVGARDVRIRFEKITEAAFNEQRGQIEQMGFRIQYDH
jgi:hypothetical protein